MLLQRELRIQGDLDVEVRCVPPSFACGRLTRNAAPYNADGVGIKSIDIRSESAVKLLA